MSGPRAASTDAEAVGKLAQPFPRIEPRYLRAGQRFTHRFELLEQALLGETIEGARDSRVIAHQGHRRRHDLRRARRGGRACLDQPPHQPIQCAHRAQPALVALGGQRIQLLLVLCVRGVLLGECVEPFLDAPHVPLAPEGDTQAAQ